MKPNKPDAEKLASHRVKQEGALAAMRRAARSAHRRAAARGDKIAIWRNGEVVWIDPIVDP
ncbi:MAG: hypothetical protein J4G19_01615 [Pseudomonadales bacterium]|nr:hypothetical protein [Pseudomonadales bacterium]